MKLVFSLQIHVRCFLKFILSFQVCVVQHAQIPPPPQKKNQKKNQQFFAMSLQYLKKDVRESCPVMFVTCFLAQPGCRKFLPEDCNTLIKQQLCWERLPSLLSLLQDDAFQQKQGVLQQIKLWPSNKPRESCIRSCITNNSTQSLHECTTMLQLKVYIFYVVRKLVGHPPYQECPINLALIVFPFVFNSRSLNHQFFLFSFPIKFLIIK